MEKRRLGRSALHVSPLCLGGNVFGWTADEATSFKVLDAYVDAGLNFIDTADVYSTWAPGHVGGESETIIGKWMKGRGNRDKLVIATKVGSEMAPAKGPRKAIFARRRGVPAAPADRPYRSLSIPPGRSDTPMEETLETYGALIKAGKVRAIGASNFTAARWPRR